MGFLFSPPKSLHAFTISWLHLYFYPGLYVNIEVAWQSLKWHHRLAIMVGLEFSKYLLCIKLDLVPTAPDSQPCGQHKFLGILYAAEFSKTTVKYSVSNLIKYCRL